MLMRFGVRLEAAKRIAKAKAPRAKAIHIFIVLDLCYISVLCMSMSPSKGQKEPRLPSNAVKELLQMAGCGCKGDLVGFNSSSVANFDVVGGLNLKVSIHF